MLSVKVYLIGTFAVVGVWLSIHFSYWFTLLFAGALTWATTEYLKDRKAARMQAFLDEIEMQKLAAEAQVAQARADLEREAVETARTRRGLIPDGYVGAQLYRPIDTNLYHVWSYKQEVTPAVVKVQEAASQPAIVASLPRAASVYDLLPELDSATGRILLGYDTDGPVWLSVDELLSVAMAGNSRRGKSRALLWLVLQLIKQDVTVMVLDGKGDLRKWLSPRHFVAYQPHEIAQTVDTLLIEAEWRLQYASQESDASMLKPIIVIIDELDLVLGRYDKTLKLIEYLTKKTASVNMHGIYSNQSVPADLLGGVKNRGVVTSRICFYCDDEAAQMIGVRESNGGKALLQLIAPPAPAGLAIARTVAFGWKLMAFPFPADSMIPMLLTDVPPVPPLPPNPRKAPMHISLSTQDIRASAPPAPKSAQEQERERIQQAIDAHPKWSNAAIARDLGMRNNNAISLIKSIREEGN